jgi:DNA-binding CsgD family transcriptional regulator
MVADSRTYSLFFKFIDTFSPTGFKGIDPDDQLLLELEEMMKSNNQFFFVADLIQVKLLFTSKRSVEMIGINPVDVTPFHFFEATHPDDIHRHSLGRSKLFGLAQGLYIAEKGNALLSTNLRLRNPVGEYPNVLIQCYLFYTLIPIKTVYEIQVHTNIEWFKKIKHGYHYYVGNKLSYFRFPDAEMLKLGNVLSDREFEIVKLVHLGLNSEQIAEKLFLSKHTINTHRNNILTKTGKAHISDLIYELKERGLL